MRPRMQLRMAVCVFTASMICFAVFGCGKKQKAAPPLKVPQVSKPAMPVSDTTDIFKEFYSEDTASKKAKNVKPKKGAKQETFSTASQQEPASSSAADFSQNGKYTVQISCVRSESFAGKLAEKMKAKGYPAYVSEVSNPTPALSGSFYRVRIGGFAGFAAAKAFGEKVLKPAGNDYWVDKKSNDKVGMEGYGLGSSSAGTNAAGSYEAASPSSSYQATPTPSSTPYKAESSPYSPPVATQSTPAATSNSPSSTSTTSPSPAPAASSLGATATPAATVPAQSSQTTTQSPSATSSQSNAAPAGSSSTTTKPSSGSSSSTSTTSGSGWGTDSTSKSGW